MKRMTCILLTLILIFSTTFTAYADTTTLSNPVVVAIAITMVAVGVTWTQSVNTYNDVRGAVNQYWDKQTQDVRDRWFNVTNLANGLTYLTIANDLYDNLKGYISSNFVQGDNNVAVIGGFNSYPASPKSFADYPYQCIIDNSGSTMLVVSKDRQDATGRVIWSTNTQMTYLLNTTSNTWNYYTSTNQQVYSMILQSSSNLYSDYTKTTLVSPKTTTDYNYKMSVSANATNPDYSYNNVSTNTKAVPYPGNSISADGTLPDTYTNDYLSNDVIGSNSDTLANTNISLPAPVDPTLEQILNGVTGLGNISADIKSSIDTQTGAINGLNTGIDNLNGTLSNTYTKVDTIAADLATTKTTIQSLSTAQGDINWEPLKIAGTTFTQVFPFSLPWDFYNILDKLDSEPIEPLIKMRIGPYTIYKTDSIIVGLPQMDWDIDMRNLSNYFAIWRSFELVVFIVLLIMRTRTLMGGDV